MLKRLSLVFLFTALSISLLCREARSQSNQSIEPLAPKRETSIVFTYLRLRDLHEGPAGIGGRFTYNINDSVGLEAEANYFPENPSGNFGETTGFFGVKAGKRIEKIGMFAKARPGFINFGSDSFDVRLSKQSFFAMDVGGVIEFYPARYAVIRLDFSDVIIPYGGATYLITIPPERLGTSHNFQQSFSIGMRF
jgi:hypothetical protein